MKILIVAVFCTYFVAVAFSKEYNSTMPSQLAEKSLPPTRPPFHLPIIHNAAITRKLSTVLVADNMRFVRNMGVLLDRDRVAFPEKHWKNNADMSVYVYCWDQTAKKLYTKNYNLHERIPEDERFYEAQGIVEVKLLPEVDYECWPYTEKRYTKSAKNLVKFQPVTAIGKLWGDTAPIAPKPYMIFKYDDEFVEISKVRGDKAPILVFTLGEPLFFKEEIAGLYVPSVTEPYGETDEKFYVRLREKCTGQLSN